MENKNFVIWLLCLALLFLGYQQFVTAPKQRAAAAAQAALQQEAGTETQAAPFTSTAAQQAAPQKSDKEEVFYAFSTSDAEIKFSSKGAGIKEYIYKDVVSDVNLTPYEGAGYFSTFAELDFSLAAQTEKSVSFKAAYGGLSVEKTYTFNEDGMNHLRVAFINKGKQDITVLPFDFSFGPGLGTVKSEMKDNERESKAVFAVQEDDKDKLVLEDRTRMKDKNSPVDGGWVWAGVQNRYFLTALIPLNWQSASMTAGKVVVGDKPRWGIGGPLGRVDVKGPWLNVKTAPQTVAAGETYVMESDFYFGEKDYHALGKLPHGLDASVDFGFWLFRDLGRLAKAVLQFFYKYTGNYGVSVILLALTLQLLLLKLTIMQQKSMFVMKKLQPEIKKIQDNYKDDKEGMQRAMLDLYKKYKFNPASGCLPLLIQLPIFIALFTAIRTSWELHGAPFTLWITDLSAKDPYYVLPLAMGAVMFFQQRLNTPPGGDPSQQAMMKWMPVVFTFIFLNFPSGLVLYWLTNSVVSFGIQIYMSKKHAQA